MNFLELCQRTRQESGISGTGPSAVTSQTGESKRIVDWVAQAWTEIQNLHDNWEWLRSEFSFTTTNYQNSYTAAQAGIASRFGRWGDVETMRAWITSVGAGSESFLTAMLYNDFRNYYLFGSRRTTYGRPISATVTPDKKLMIGPGPDTNGYTIVGEYFKGPQTLTADSDIPECPDRFHMIIVYKAMESYALYEAAPEVLTRAQNGFASLISDLELNQLPEISFPGPLA